MTNFRYVLLGVLLLSSLASLPQSNPRPGKWAQQVNNPEFKNLWKLNDSIYRSEQPTEFGLSEFCDFQVKSLLNLREDNSDVKIQQECPLKLYHVKMDPDQIKEEDVIKALRILKMAPKPVVVHCFYGSDRTGMILAMYRVVYQNWTKQEAINEMKNGGYGFHKSYTNMVDFIQYADINKIRTKLK
jgi:tyrosine-protein phosphatase SIW14